MCASPKTLSIDVGFFGEFLAAPEGARTHAHQSTRPLAFAHLQSASICPLYQRVTAARYPYKGLCLKNIASYLGLPLIKVVQICHLNKKQKTK